MRQVHQTSSERLIHLYKPGEVPVLGERSALDPSALPNGFWQRLRNVRSRRHRLTIRWGQNQFAAALGDPALSYRGHWIGSVAGIDRCLVAFWKSDAGRIRFYDLNLQNGVWTLASANVGPPPAEFSSDAPVEFAPVCDPYNPSETTPATFFVLASNGASTPLVLRTDGSGTNPNWSAELANSPVLPDGRYTSQPGFISWVNVRDSANLTITNSGAAFVFANEMPAAGRNRLKLTFPSAATVGATAEAQLTTVNAATYDDGTTVATAVDAFSLANSRQLCLVLSGDVPADSIFNYCSLEVVAGAVPTTRVVWDPTSAVDYPYPLVAAFGTGLYLIALDISDLREFDLTKVQKVKLTVKRQVPTDRTVYITNILAGGFVQGGAEHAVTWLDQACRVESTPAVCEAIRPPRMNELGGSTDLVMPLPLHEGIYYQYTIRAPMASYPTGSQKRAALYRREPGETRFSCLPKSNTVAGSMNQVITLRENVLQERKLIGRPMPPIGNSGPPIGGCLLAANNRLYVGGAGVNRDEVWISQDGFPLRFSPLIEADATSGEVLAESPVVDSFSNEQIKRIVRLPGSFVGFSPVVVFTDRGTWRLEGTDALSLGRPTRINPHGTTFPRSVAEHKGMLYYLDSERVVRRFYGGVESQPLSAWQIDDQLESGDPSACAAVVWKDSYRLAYREGGSTNRKVALYEEGLEGWFHDTYPEGQDHAAYVFLPGSSQVLAVTSLGRVMRVEATGQTTDAGEGIEAELLTRRLSLDHWRQGFFGRVGMVCEKSTGGRWSVERIDPADSLNPGSASGEIDTESSVKDWAWRFDQDGTGNPCGIATVACDVRLSSSTFAPGKIIHAIVMEIGSRFGGADVA